MEETIELAELIPQLQSVMAEVVAGHRPCLITESGQPKAVMIEYSEYLKLQQTKTQPRVAEAAAEYVVESDQPPGEEKNKPWRWPWPKADMDWFSEHYLEIHEKFAGKWVAVRDGKIAAWYSNVEKNGWLLIPISLLPLRSVTMSLSSDNVGTRIKLEVRRYPGLAQARVSLSAIRVLCLVSFKAGDQYTEPEQGIVDTGAGISIIPPRIWSNLPHTKIADNTIWGISTNPDCFERSIFGEVACRLEDENGATPDFRLHADLVYNDDLPLVLGFLDVLERGLLHVQVAVSDSFLEFR